MQWRTARTAAKTRCCTGLSRAGISARGRPRLSPGYERDDRWREEQAFRENCEKLRDAEREIRDRLAYTPYGEERERLQYRLGEIHQASERSWHR